MPAATTLASATVCRLLQPLEDSIGGQDRRRFACLEAGPLWMTDCMHGAKVGSDPRDGAAARPITCAFLDDATRVILHAAFAECAEAEGVAIAGDGSRLVWRSCRSRAKWAAAFITVASTPQDRAAGRRAGAVPGWP